MGEHRQKSVPLLLWPFYAIWRLLTFILQLTGRIICAILGLAIMAAGTTLTITIAGAPLGIPLTIFGFLLLIRALF
ncbi:MAG: hypothetical protein KJO31_03730 [Gammaproteobacteria bacterium]|nr:hypothetical protein [Gammaproteobacteria bacterium]